VEKNINKLGAHLYFLEVVEGELKRFLNTRGLLLQRNNAMLLRR